MNYVFTSGRLVTDPEIKMFGEQKVCVFRFAADTRRKKKDGTRLSNFYRVTVRGAVVDACAKYLKKGSEATICGNLALVEYEGKNGKGSAMEIDTNEVKFHGKLEANENAESRQVSAAVQEVAEEEDDLPF